MSVGREDNTSLAKNSAVVWFSKEATIWFNKKWDLLLDALSSVQTFCFHALKALKTMRKQYYDFFIKFIEIR